MIYKFTKIAFENNLYEFQEDVDDDDDDDTKLKLAYLCHNETRGLYYFTGFKFN